jgi:hypothetical protein
MDKQQLTIGQTFSIDNPPYEVSDETWEIIDLSYPSVTFSYTKYWLRDAAYIHISTTDTVAGKAIGQSDRGVIVELNNFPYLDWGLRIQGDRAIYLSESELGYDRSHATRTTLE